MPLFINQANAHRLSEPVNRRIMILKGFVGLTKSRHSLDQNRPNPDVLPDVDVGKIDQFLCLLEILQRFSVFPGVLIGPSNVVQRR